MNQHDEKLPMYPGVQAESSERRTTGLPRMHAPLPRLKLSGKKFTSGTETLLMYFNALYIQLYAYWLKPLLNNSSI